MITPADLQQLFETWEPPLKPDAVPEAAFRLWISAHTLVNRRISFEQGAYLHAEANLYGQQHNLADLCIEYDHALSALLSVTEEPRMMNQLWLALDMWGLYDPTPEAQRYNHQHKIDRILHRASLLEQLIRTFR